MGPPEQQEVAVMLLTPNRRENAVSGVVSRDLDFEDI